MAAAHDADCGVPAQSFRVSDFDGGALRATVLDSVRDKLVTDFVTPALTGGNEIVPRLEPSTLYKFDEPGAAGGPAANAKPPADTGLPPGKEVVDKALRDSTWCRITHESGLELADKVLRDVSLGTSSCNFVRVRDHVTLIRYEEGGFFKPHHDFSQVISLPNRAREVHVMVVLVAPEEGGELRLTDKAGKTHTYACEQGGVLVFDKSCRHEGLPVKKGNKVVLLIDALAVLARDAPTEHRASWVRENFVAPGVISANLELVADVARRNRLPFFLITQGNGVTRIHHRGGILYYSGDPDHDHCRDVPDKWVLEDMPADEFPLTGQHETYPNQGWEVTEDEDAYEALFHVEDWMHGPNKYWAADACHFAIQDQELPNGHKPEWARDMRGVLADSALFDMQALVEPTVDSRELLRFKRLETEDDVEPVDVIHEMGCNEGDYDIIVTFSQLAGVIIPPGTIVKV